MNRATDHKDDEEIEATLTPGRFGHVRDVSSAYNIDPLKAPPVADGAFLYVAPVLRQHFRSHASHAHKYHHPASINQSVSHPVAPPLSGVWLPIVTPFMEGEIDFVSYRRLLNAYLQTQISGIIPLGTTGESPSIDEGEVDAIVELTLEVVDKRVPVYIGVGGNSTKKVIRSLRRLERHPFAGILSICPYYNRPSEDGICQHFRAIAESTDRNVLIYNIPYRTGVNLSNDSLLSLSETPNIVGIKDSCANVAQSIDLLLKKPPGFSVMTGEDALFYTMLALGADGGILASAHIIERKRSSRCFGA